MKRNKGASYAGHPKPQKTKWKHFLI